MGRIPIALGMSIAVTACGGGVARAAIAFGPATNYGTNTSPNGVTVADVNGDGKADIVVSNYSSGDVSLLLGNGDGTFQAKTDLPSGGQAAQTVVRDLNGDNRQDIVVANGAGLGKLSVLLQQVGGTFAAHQDYAAGLNEQSIALADLDGNGKLDAIVGDYLAAGNGMVSVLAGGDNGTFGAPQTYATSDHPTGLAVANFNDGTDTHLDLVVGENSVSDARLFLGQAGGTFGTPGTTFGSLSYPNGISVADLNADGEPDLAISEVDAVAIRLGNGNATFTAKPNLTTGSGNDTYNAAVADFDGDGKLDVAAGRQDASGKVAVFPGNGDGTFGTRLDVDGPAQNVRLAAGDLDGDGNSDLALLTSGGAADNNVYVLLNLAPGVTTGAASGVSQTDATLNATALPHGAATNVVLEYGTTTSYGSSTPAVLTSATTSPTPISSPISGLTAGTTYHFRAVATSANGTHRSADATFTTNSPPAPPGGGGGSGNPNNGGGGPAGGGSTTPLSLSGLSVTPSSFAVSRRSTALIAKAALGTTVRYTLSRAASVSLKISRASTGRRAGSKCRKPTPALRHAPHCTRYSAIGTLVRASAAGANKVAFSGRLGHSALALGRYRLTAVAVDTAGAHAATGSARFTIAHA